MPEEKLRIDVWSDIACPWCYVGKRRLEHALEQFPHENEVEVVWHAFELDRDAPKERDPSVSYAARLASKYGCTTVEAEAMIARMTKVASADGLELRFDKVRSGNTFDAHRLLRFAKERGFQGAMNERLFRAYMTEGENIGDVGVLSRLAGEAGLDAAAARAALLGDRFSAEVREDEETAREIGVRGVPFFVLGGRYAVSGAQPSSLLLRALTEAWAERSQHRESQGRGAMCGPDGC